MPWYLSIDPGIGNTGLCLWRNGQAKKIHTIKGPPNGAKYDLATRIGFLLDGIMIFIGGRQIKTTAIEAFQGHVKHNMLSMMKCSAAQGAMIAIAHTFSDEVVMINKKTESKGVAFYAAIKAGFAEVDEHGADAFRIGQLAGFDGKK